MTDRARTFTGVYVLGSSQATLFVNAKDGGEGGFEPRFGASATHRALEELDNKCGQETTKVSPDI
jgi:hypothetical protein